MTAASQRPPSGKRRLALVLRWAFSLGALALTLWYLDVGSVAEQLVGIDAPWLAAALLLTVPLTALLAWRWHFTAARVGAPLPFVVAWREYYVSVLLNQVLPGGVVGDFARVVRQSDGEARPVARVASSVVLERASGQLVLWIALLATVPVLGASSRTHALGLGAAAIVGGLTVAVVGARHPRLRATWLGRALGRIHGDIREAFVSRGALAFQLTTSVLVLTLLVLAFACCAWAVGTSLRLADAFVLVPWVLAATALPLTVGGWGVREATTAAVFDLVALPPTEGVAASLVFGAVSLVGALPGLPLLLRRDRTTPPPAHGEPT